MNMLQKVGLVIVVLSEMGLGARLYSEVNFDFPALPLNNPLLLIHH